ncbi:MAG: PEP-CTERM sorting domain-containing protein [Myxococcota bacterium]
MLEDQTEGETALINPFIHILKTIAPPLVLRLRQASHRPTHNSLHFLNLGGDGFNRNAGSGLIDAVAASEVPEPSSTLMLFAGIVMLSRLAGRPKTN